MKDLGTLQGDYASVAPGANEKGEVVGFSFDKTGAPRAFLRRNGVMIDLNTLLPADSPIYALGAGLINARGRDCRRRSNQQWGDARIPGYAVSVIAR
jgi:probable HAF family extracellular repeat protein